MSIEAFFSPKTILQLLHSTTLQDVLPKRQVITIRSSSSVSEALKVNFITIFINTKTLSHNRILSAPVQDGASGKYLGFVDMFHLLCFIMKNYTEEGDGNVEYNQLSEYTSMKILVKIVNNK